VSDTKIIPAGELVLLTLGDYSDYSALSIVRARVDLDLLALMTAFQEATGLVVGPLSADSTAYRFFGWLAGGGYVEIQPPYFEWHIGLHVAHRALQPTIKDGRVWIGIESAPVFQTCTQCGVVLPCLAHGGESRL
jgi:hypothetical protein